MSIIDSLVILIFFAFAAWVVIKSRPSGCCEYQGVVECVICDGCESCCECGMVYKKGKLK